MGVLRLRGGADEEKKPETEAADDDDARRVNLMSQEGDQFEVEVKVAKMSELVKTMIPEEADEDEEAQEIPLPNVKSHVLAKVIEFCRATPRSPCPRSRSPSNRPTCTRWCRSGTRTTSTSTKSYCLNSYWRRTTWTSSPS